MRLLNALKRAPAAALDEESSNGAGKSRSDAYTVLVFSDLHGKPLHMEIMAAVKAHAPRIVCFIGDLLSADTFTSWVNESDADYAAEYAAVHNVIADVASAPGVEEVLLCYGNHERRIFRWFMGRGANMLQARERALTMNVLPLDTIAEAFANVSVSNLSYDYTTAGGMTFEAQFTSRHLIMLHDAYLGHPSIARKGPASSVIEWKARLDNWRKPLGLPEGRLYLMGHTHQAGVWHLDGGHLAVGETGCMMQPGVMAYVYEDLQKAGFKAPVLGYVSFEQAGERTNLSTVKFHLL